jgi:hypothetical protein
METNKESVQDTVTYTRYSEKMTSLIVKNYDSPDKFFSMARNLFLKYYSSWSEMGKIQAIMNLFRDAYRAYNAIERSKLGNRFLNFCTGLKMKPTTYNRLFVSFWLLIRKRAENRDFIVKAIRLDCFMDGVNQEFVEEFNSADSPIYREVFSSRIEEIADYIYDDTYFYIAEHSLDQYTLYDQVMKALLKRGKEKVLISFLKNRNLLVSKECYQEIISYATEKQMKELLKFAYHNFLFKYSVSFEDFFSYYQLLNEEERIQEQYYLNRIVEANHLEKPFLIMQDEEDDPSCLKNLSMDEFSSLSDMIQTKFADTYSEYLLSAIEKRWKRGGEDYQDVFSCLRHYPHVGREVLLSSCLWEISLHDENSRKEYVFLLHANGLLEEAGIYSYGEVSHVSH